jgi:pimeloyl-ACP methyl ester carboxylesterase
MAVFVLVHGAFHGGWCYARVAALLRQQGHEVFTPTLTGLGQRAHLTAGSIDLSTHIEDVVNVLICEELDQVILCRHSYGGMVITGVAAHLGERLDTLVYLDAIVPEHGQSLFDIVGPEIAERTTASACGSGWVPALPASYFNVNAEDVDWVERRCGPHPLACFTQTVELTGKEALVRRRVYILAENYAFGLNARVCEKLSRLPGWTTASLKSGHDVMIDEPGRLAELLAAQATPGTGSAMSGRAD